MQHLTMLTQALGILENPRWVIVAAFKELKWLWACIECVCVCVCAFNGEGQEGVQGRNKSSEKIFFFLIFKNYNIKCEGFFCMVIF